MIDLKKDLQKTPKINLEMNESLSSDKWVREALDAAFKDEEPKKPKKKNPRIQKKTFSSETGSGSPSKRGQRSLWFCLFLI
ncbi:hypothetical protein P0G10_19310 [Eubacteriales bacterium DFI.9.88]|nr:hypothetical protein [Eubacteriales bacterium DFI.9.88]